MIANNCSTTVLAHIDIKIFYPCVSMVIENYYTYRLFNKISLHLACKNLHQHQNERVASILLILIIHNRCNTSVKGLPNSFQRSVKPMKQYFKQVDKKVEINYGRK